MYEFKSMKDEELVKKEIEEIEQKKVIDARMCNFFILVFIVFLILALLIIF